MSKEKDLPYDERVKRARITATVFGVLAIVAMICFVYAFFQKEAYDKVKASLENRDKQLIECKQYSETLEKALHEQKLSLEKAIRGLAEVSEKTNVK